MYIHECIHWNHHRNSTHPINPRYQLILSTHHPINPHTHALLLPTYWLFYCLFSNHPSIHPSYTSIHHSNHTSFQPSIIPTIHPTYPQIPQEITTAPSHWLWTPIACPVPPRWWSHINTLSFLTYHHPLPSVTSLSTPLNTLSLQYPPLLYNLSYTTSLYFYFHQAIPPVPQKVPLQATQTMTGVTKEVAQTPAFKTSFINAISSFLGVNR